MGQLTMVLPRTAMASRLLSDSWPTAQLTVRPLGLISTHRGIGHLQ